MLELTFGEQVKIVLSRKDMTIKQLAEMIEERTGKKMSRQNLTQRLSRDNFQEQDMRLIASILECPFHLSILEEDTDTEHPTYESKLQDKSINIMDEEPEQLTLNLELDDEPEQEIAARQEPGVTAQKEPEESAEKEREITIGELVDLAEEPEYSEEAAYEEQTYTEPVENTEDNAYGAESEYEEPEHEDVNEILEEVAAIEAEEKKAREEKEREQEKEQEREQEKPRGWRAYLQRRKKKQTEADHEDESEVTDQTEPAYAMNQEQAQEMTEEVPEEEQYQEEEQGYEEYVQENEQEMQDEFADTSQDWEVPEDENVGEINPYTGMEYESNSVRIHPKRIGYVQVYDRSDHQWTDMTEWAFLGYQERKKALLGKDYEPPIYLD